MKVLLIILAVALLWTAGLSAAEQAPTLTPDELENYQFDLPPEEPPVIDDLNVGQRYTLGAQRDDFMALIARHLGVGSLKDSKADLAVIQQLIDREVLKPDQVREWQSVGVVFGDILVAEFGLRWISYEDDLGVSKALRWQQTENYVFPITVFSKRLRFGEELNAFEIFDKLAADITRFKKLPTPVAATRRSR